MPSILETVGPRSSAAPLTYTLAESGTVDVMSVFASFDGSAAAGTFRPVLTVRSQSGAILARSFPSDSVAAGDSADVTFAPFLRDDAHTFDLVTTDGSTTVDPTDVLSIGSGLTLTQSPTGTAVLTSTGATGTPRIVVADAVTNSVTNNAVGTALAIGKPTGMLVGDWAIMAVSTVVSAAITGTVSPVDGAAGWGAIVGSSHDTNYVWRVFAKQITGLAEPSDWDQVAITGVGAGTQSISAAILLLRNSASANTPRATATTTTTADITPLTAGPLAVYARPGDLLLAFANSKNGSGGISPPSGYTEVVDQVQATPAGLWTYLAYKVADGPQSGAEASVSLAIAAGSASDHNALNLTAYQHYGPA